MVCSDDEVLKFIPRFGLKMLTWGHFDMTAIEPTRLFFYFRGALTFGLLGNVLSLLSLSLRSSP